MSGKNNLFISIIVLAVGITLICLFQRVDILNWVVILMGVLFIIPGVFSLVSGMSQTGKSTSSVIAGFGAIALGVVMCLFPEPFARVIVYIFAAMVILGGIYHIVFLGWIARPFVLPWYFYIIPVLMIAAGLLIMLTPLRALNSTVVLITGIAFTASAINSIIEYIAIHPSQEKSVGSGEQQ